MVRADVGLQGLQAALYRVTTGVWAGAERQVGDEGGVRGQGTGRAPLVEAVDTGKINYTKNIKIS